MPAQGPLVEIRVAGRDDIAALKNIMRAAYKDVAKKFNITAENCPKHPSQTNSDWIKDDMASGVSFRIMTADKAPVACVAIRNPSPAVCVLERLSVLPKAQKQGYGRAMVDYVIEEARSAGKKKISIAVIAEYAELKTWFAGMGFIEKDTKPFENMPFQLTFMVKDI